MIVAIDGEAGAGKTTVASAVAGKLGWPLLESGSLYRAVGLQALQNGTDLSNAEAVTSLARNSQLRLECRTGGNIVFLNEEDVTSGLRDEEVGAAASAVAKVAEVRRLLLPIQREAAEDGDLVAEGRDMGSVVFPHAEVKFFLEASIEVRARRRKLQLAQTGIEPDLKAVQREMERRDDQDAERELSPMLPADGAIVIDTSNKDAEEVIEAILRRVGELSGRD